jgi:hypothetical protein
MTLAEQITALKGKHAESEQLDPVILLRVLDSITVELKRMDGIGDWMKAAMEGMLGLKDRLNKIEEKIGTLAEKVPYRDPHSS